MVTVTLLTYSFGREGDDYYLGALVNLMEGHNHHCWACRQKHPHSTPTSKSTVIAGPVEKELRLQLFGNSNGSKGNMHSRRLYRQICSHCLSPCEMAAFEVSSGFPEMILMCYECTRQIETLQIYTLQLSS